MGYPDSKDKSIKLLIMISFNLIPIACNLTYADCQVLDFVKIRKVY